MKFKLIFVVSTAILAISTVFAANWKAVEGFDYYVDLDSRVREGDLASIRIRYGYDIERWEFDCVKWRFINNNTQLKPNTLGNDVALIACKRKWEVWK